jgi:hypothetical protein
MGGSQMNDQRIFTYRKTIGGLLIRFVEMVIGLVGLLLLALSINSLINAVIGSTELPMPVVLAPVGLLALALGSYTHCPDIRVNGETLSIKIVWKWQRLDRRRIKVREYLDKTLIVTSSDLPFAYFWLFSRDGIGKKCFVVNKYISDSEDLFHILKSD